ncbi:hypothetical protein Bca52824_023867 [Brassica carinata]|uniref:Uncharacterized protein n=1 Tax=Brassica carinata TaxID=52824 RepID=A0A8X8ATQ6_BRACI|nr:hypothetical protein Bca52824_023867 [Brassica carinata]
MVSERKQDVPYEHSKKTEDHSMIVSDSHSIDNQRSNGKTKRLASAIVTPSRITTGQEENVTLRNKEVSCLLSFSPSSFQVHENGNDNDQIIEALNDMEIVEQYDGGMMECDVQDDDLLGEDLMTMEEVKQPVSGPSTMKVHSGEKKERSQRVQSHKRGRSMNVPLGIQSKKATFLRRGSPRPRLRSRSAGSPESRSQRHGLKKHDGGMMECDVQDDDLLGEDLMTMEEVKQPVSGPSTMKVHSGKKGTSQRVQSHKRGRSMNVPLGIQSKKATFLRRGSPRHDTPRSPVS